jgi:hypothetical protein
MPLTESIPLQQKIADLEQRIEKLEKERGGRTHVTVTRTRYSSAGEPFGEHWDKMWEHFSAFMKSVFH